MTPVKMLLSYNNNEKVVEVPVIPDKLPEIVQELANEEFTAHTKTLTLLGSKKPRTFTLDLFLPTREYEFCKGNGEEVISLLKYVAEKKIPARLVVTDNMTELLNIAIAIRNFRYYYDTVKNIRANIDCVEYIFVNTQTAPAEESTTPVFKETAVTYKNTTSQIKSANIEGHTLIKARDVLSLLGKEVDWNAERKQVIADGELLDIHTEVYDGCAYCYVRDVAGAVGLDVDYNPNDKSVTLKER